MESASPINITSTSLYFPQQEITTVLVLCKLVYMGSPEDLYAAILFPFITNLVLEARGKYECRLKRGQHFLMMLRGWLFISLLLIVV